MRYLLFPGRHHLLTNFQYAYLSKVIEEEGIAALVWAVTSANHSNTRRNPLPANRREVAIEDFCSTLKADCLVYNIDDIGKTDRFADYVLKRIEVESRGELVLTPDNTLLGCSTPEVILMYEELGFRNLAVELVDADKGTYCARRPWELLLDVVEAGNAWRVCQPFLTLVAPATQKLFLKYNLGDVVVDLHESELLTDDGDLTETRDYNTYVRSFDKGAERKYKLVKDHIAPGRIVDVGCCTGALIRELTMDDRFHESDFYGIEIARQLYVECLHRKAQGAFGNDHVFFYQKDFCAGPMFKENSVNTFLTFALTHEIESYSGRDELLAFFRLLYDQLTYGGRWINVDVVGPKDRSQVVHMKLNCEDGRNDDWDREFDEEDRDELKNYLEGLSTSGKFLRFARDYRSGYGYSIEYEKDVIAGDTYFVLSQQDACEFLSKKDYLDNWQSEMHETFCFWNFEEWSTAVTEAGFKLTSASRPIRNSWIIDNRYRCRAELFEKGDDGLERLEYPVTNLLLVAEKI